MRCLFITHFSFFFSKRLNTTKKNLLDAEGSGSVAVRMALGETELVSETREFLESNGVKLDVFGQVSTPCFTLQLCKIINFQMSLFLVKV